MSLVRLCNYILSCFLTAATWGMVVLIPGSLNAAPMESLILALSKTPLSLPFYVAQSQGYFEGEGVQIKINDVIGGVRTMQQLLGGAVDLATSSDTVVMFNSFGRKDFAVLSSFVTSDEDVRMIAGPNMVSLQPAHIVGKRIGTIIASASHYYLDNWLLFHGVDPKNVTVVGLAPEAMELALIKGNVDAVSVWEPFGYKILRDVPRVRVYPNPGTHTLSFNLMVHAKHVGVKDAELVKILRALDRAQRFIKAEPLKAQAILRERLQIDQPYIDWIWPRYHYALALDQSLLVTLESQARWARQEGYVAAARSPNYLDFIYPGPLSAVRRDAVGIVK